MEKKNDGDMVGIAAEKRMETYASILGVLLPGKTYVMLHPDYPAECHIRLIPTSGHYRPLLGSKLLERVYNTHHSG